MQTQDIVDAILGHGITLKFFIETRYIKEIMPASNLAPATSRDYLNKLNVIINALGNKIIDEITVKDISDFLDKQAPVNSNRYRSLLIVIFKHAVAKGLVRENEAEKTLPRQVKKQRKRLSKELYDAIYKLADDWFKNTMDIALLTLLRREDITPLLKTDIKTEIIDNKAYRFLYVIHNKTKKHGESAYIKILIGEKLAQVIDRCFLTPIITPYLIARTPDRIVSAKNKSHWSQITPDYLTKEFSRLRDLTGLCDKLDALEKPTFHEIRSLGIKLYEDQGLDAQAIAGHTTRAMTEKYKEGHEIQWTETASL